MRILGPQYVVWDKAATTLSRKPGRTTLYATFRIDDAELSAIRAADAPIDRTYKVELVDAEGTVHAEIEKVIYIRLRSAAAKPPLSGKESDAHSRLEHA